MATSPFRRGCGNTPVLLGHEAPAHHILQKTMGKKETMTDQEPETIDGRGSGLSRRDFLKLSGLLSAGAFLGPKLLTLIENAAASTLTKMASSHRTRGSVCMILAFLYLPFTGVPDANQFGVSMI